MSDSLMRAVLLLLLSLLPIMIGAQNASQPQVCSDAAIQLGKAAAEKVFGANQFSDIELYFDADGNISVYAVEYSLASDHSPVTVIVSARRDDVPVIMLWHGLPKHKNPEVLAAAADKIQESLGVAVDVPSFIFWLDAYEVWAEYEQINPQTGEPILYNLYKGQIITDQDLVRKWSNRLTHFNYMRQAKASEAQINALGVAASAEQRRQVAALEHANYIESQWNDADAFLAKTTPQVFRAIANTLAEPSKSNVIMVAAGDLAEAVDKTDWTFTTGGNVGWLRETTVSYYGGDAAQNGDISDSQESWMQTTVSGPGTVKFYWKVSSESGWDYLEFYIDVTRQDRISGTVDWTQKTFTVASGSHILKWRYMKDGSVSSGSDSGWIDKVEWVAGGASITVTYPNNSGITFQQLKDYNILMEHLRVSGKHRED